MRTIEIIGPLFSPCEAARSVINYKSGGKTWAAGRPGFLAVFLIHQKSPEKSFETGYNGGFFISAADKKAHF
mgnify:CR=1 FL=1